MTWNVQHQEKAPRKLYPEILVNALLVGLIVGGLIDSGRLFLLILPRERVLRVGDSILLYSTLNSWISFLLEPMLLFTVVCFLGRKMDLRRRYVAVALSLFIGGVLGHSTGYHLSLYLQGGGAVFPDLLSLVVIVLGLARIEVSFGLRVLFTGFTAITLAYLRSTREERT